ncbi:MAG: response regulator transcription factor [Anaerohalosphaera sp.]|nr:response regulator transcription factor [Anaerohalosphaera sp.]
MAVRAKAHIFLVDDDPAILKSTSLILESSQYECTCFIDAESCLASFCPRSCDLFVTDVQMPGRSGIELLQHIKKVAPWIPVIVFTSYADIPLAVEALKKGAFDFIEKPLDVDSFLEMVDLAVRQKEYDNSAIGKPLTKTEVIVLKLILKGMSNRGIAFTLKRSERTIEVHRSHIMTKLNVDNVVDLVKRASSMGFDTPR